MRFTDLMMAFPALLLAIALAAIFQPSVWIVSPVIAMVNWVQIARLPTPKLARLAPATLSPWNAPRGRNVAYSRRAFNSTSGANGAGLGHTRHLHHSPAGSYSIVPRGGVQPPTPSWGNIIFESQSYFTSAPGWCSFPARRLCCCRSLSISLVTPCATPSIPA